MGIVFFGDLGVHSNLVRSTRTEEGRDPKMGLSGFFNAET